MHYTGSTSISYQSNTASDYKLYQNYPNPFNPATRIALTVAERQQTTVRVYDVLGREVVTLLHEVKDPGMYLLEFDASSYAGGVYYCQMRSGAYTQTRRMVFVK